VVAAVSTPLAGHVRELSKNRANVMVLPNGANPDLFRPRADLRANMREELAWSDSVIVGWAGILREWHGVELLIRAVARVPGLKLLIIGDGPDRGRLDTVIQNLNLGDRVMFTGRVSHADVMRYVGAVDVAVSSAERATVAPRSRNIEDLIDDGVDGLLFEPDSEEALVAVLRRLAEDEGLRERLGRQARLKIVRFRNWQRNAEIVIRAITDESEPRVSPAEQLGRT